MTARFQSFLCMLAFVGACAASASYRGPDRSVRTEAPKEAEAPVNSPVSARESAPAPCPTTVRRPVGAPDDLALPAPTAQDLCNRFVAHATDDYDITCRLERELTPDIVMLEVSEVGDVFRYLAARERDGWRIATLESVADGYEGRGHMSQSLTFEGFRTIETTRGPVHRLDLLQEQWDTDAEEEKEALTRTSTLCARNTPTSALSCFTFISEETGAWYDLRREGENYVRLPEPQSQWNQLATVAVGADGSVVYASVRGGWPKRGSVDDWLKPECASYRLVNLGP